MSLSSNDANSNNPTAKPSSMTAASSSIAQMAKNSSNRVKFLVEKAHDPYNIAAVQTKNNSDPKG